MTEQRNITLHIDAVTKTQIAEITGHDKLNSALGYLAGWNMSFPHVTIGGGIYDGVPEIYANYSKEFNGPIGYSIGAVWHDDHFGFHS